MAPKPHASRQSRPLLPNLQFSFCNFQFSILRIVSFFLTVFFAPFLYCAESPTNHPSPITNHSTQIAQAADALHPILVQIRRDLHMHPELSNREERTAHIVADRLRALGF